MRIDVGDALATLRVRLSEAAPSADQQDVALAALWIVQAEVLGLPEFGIRMLARDLERLTTADLAAGPRSDGGVADAVAAVDAHGVPGVVALATAVRYARQGVDEHGMAIVGVRGAGALGVLGLAARTLASRGAVALIAAQSPAAVAPWGAHSPAIGTNPLALAVARRDAPPLVLDYATSALTLAAVREARATNTALPAGTAVDDKGVATTDAATVAAILPTALVGSLTGLVVEVLAGVAVGGRTGSPETDAGRGAVIIAFDPARTGAADAAAAASRLDHDWQAAGGHLPARFDALPLDDAHLPRSIEAAPDVAEWLGAQISGPTA